MGLDMYLTAKKYVEKINWEKLQANDELKMDSPEVINPLWSDVVSTAQLSDVAIGIYGVHVDVTCAYWRKANQIHGWFVKNVQQGKDDCGEYYVSKDKLKELLDLVNTALNTKDPNLLPPTAGFFFGGYDIDEYYWADLKDTKKQLERVLALSDLSKLSFYYNSSW